MKKTLALIGFVSCLFADDATSQQLRQQVQDVKSQNMEFAPGGSLRLKNSTGRLVIEGWDRPEMQITTIKMTKASYGADQRADATRDLDAVKTTVEHNGADIVVTTDYPRKGRVKSALGSGIDVDLTYEIKVPRNTKLTADHGDGDVDISNLSSDIHVTARQGQITIFLPTDEPHAIEARSKLGGVSSFLPGHQKRPWWLVGQQFSSAAPASAPKLDLKVASGDILIYGPLRIGPPPKP